jgi:hypothetical protein
MSKKPFLKECQKRTARITIMTQPDIKSKIEDHARRERHPLSTYCEGILIDATECKKNEINKK